MRTSGDFVGNLERHIDAYQTGMAASLARGLYGRPLLSKKERAAYNRSRAGWRYMLKQFMELSTVDEFNESKKLTGLAAWLP